MAKRGFFARLLGLPAGPAVPKPAKDASAPKSAPGPRPMTADRKALIEEAMRVHGRITEELGEDEIQKMAKAITGKEMR